MVLDRLFEIIYILMENESVSAKQLADRLEVSTKTIYRDIDRLSVAGVPIYATKGKGGGISLMDGFVLNKALFNEEEKLNILSAVNAFEALRPDKKNAARKEEMTQRARSGTRLNAFFGDTSANWIEVDFSSWGADSQEAMLFQTLKTAILAKKVVSFGYVSTKGEATERMVEPLKIGFKNQSWYLYGFCRTRKAPRFFKLSRIRDLCVSEGSFERAIPNEIFPKEPLKYQDVYVKMKLKLSPKQAYRAFDEFANFEILPDGSVIVEGDVPQGEWMMRYISSFGEDCEILEPQEMREEYKKQLQKILNLYL